MSAWVPWVHNAGTEYYQEPYLPKAPSDMSTKLLTEMNTEWPYYMPRGLLGRCWRSMNMATDVYTDIAHDSGCQWYLYWLTMLYTWARESGNALGNTSYEWPSHQRLMRRIDGHIWLTITECKDTYSRSYYPCKVNPIGSMLTEHEWLPKHLW